MALLDPIRRGAGELYESLGEGWDWLRRRGAAALTRFHPSEDERSIEAVPGGDRWGLLASSVAEMEDEVVVKVEAPGMESADFTILVDEGSLVVRGEKRVDREEKKARYHVVEVAYGRFERRIPLPCEVDSERASASYRRGVLSVHLPRAERERRRQIRVEGG
jgi:HSP20 family protein